MSFLERSSKAIREAGGRMTGQRRLVIELLSGTDHLMDAEELYQQARLQDEAISLATVYRTLSTLESAGLVQQHYYSREHDRKVYEPVIEDEKYHFTCRVCHKVIPFRSELVQQLKRKLEHEMQVQVAHACVCIDGLCPDCRDKETVQ